MKKSNYTEILVTKNFLKACNDGRKNQERWLSVKHVD